MVRSVFLFQSSDKREQKTMTDRLTGKVAAITGGGGGIGGNPSGAGGSGVVIISAPRAATSTTGSPTVTTSGGDYIHTFTGSGSLTSLTPAYSVN